MPALYVNLMPKDQDLGYQRSSRPEQPDQRRPNKAARFPHRTEALRDSAPAVSLIRFTTGTTTRSRVSSFMNKFRKLGLIGYNGHIEVHNSLLSAVLHEKPQLKED